MVRLLGSLLARFFPEAKILLFTDGSKALAEVEREAPDLLTTDWNRAGFTGADVLESLAAKRATYPVVLITGDAALNSNARDRMLAPWCQRLDLLYLLKPFHFTDLGKSLAARFCLKPHAEQLKQKPRRVIILDDEQGPADAMKMLLKFNYPGVDVLDFTDARKALAEVQREVPDLYVTNWPHPKPMAEDLLRLLAKEKPNCPTIVWSAVLDRMPKVFREELESQGFLPNYFSKPILLEDLRQALSEHCFFAEEGKTTGR